jgi:hypothetical protein
MAKWMLVNPEGDKHPTTVRVNGADEPSVVDKIADYEVFHRRIDQSITAADEENLRKRVLVTLSRLTGRDLKTMTDLALHTRTLQQERKESVSCSPPVL